MTTDTETLLRRLAQVTTHSRDAQANLSELKAERVRLINALRDHGVTDRQIARHLDVHPTAITRLAGSKRARQTKETTS